MDNLKLDKLSKQNMAMLFGGTDGSGWNPFNPCGCSCSCGNCQNNDAAKPRRSIKRSQRDVQHFEN